LTRSLRVGGSYFILQLLDTIKLQVQFDKIRIQLIDVSFKYPNSDKYVLKNINLHIEPGEKIAFAGLNGAGKSTLIKLIIGLYKPTSGKVLINGVEMEKIDIGEYQKRIGVVFQDFYRFAFTLKENICLSDIESRFNESRVHEAAKGADLLDLVYKLDQGYDTYLTKQFSLDGVSDLSLGQWQKIAIARAFLKKCDVLILDEPASSLDPLAEFEIMKRFHILAKDKTAIFITHRLSGIKNMDRIIVLKDGYIVEEGTHQELMYRNGEYAYLFNTQSEGYVS